MVCTEPWIQSPAPHNLGVLVHPLIPALEGWRQENQKCRRHLWLHSKVKSLLNYMGPSQNKLAQQVKAFTSRPVSTSVQSPESHMVEDKNCLLWSILWPPHVCYGMWTHTHTLSQTQVNMGGKKSSEAYRQAAATWSGKSPTFLNYSESINSLFFYLFSKHGFLTLWAFLLFFHHVTASLPHVWPPCWLTRNGLPFSPPPSTSEQQLRLTACLPWEGFLLNASKSVLSFHLNLLFY